MRTLSWVALLALSLAAARAEGKRKSTPKSARSASSARAQGGSSSTGSTSTKASSSARVQMNDPGSSDDLDNWEVPVDAPVTRQSSRRARPRSRSNTSS